MSSVAGRLARYCVAGGLTCALYLGGGAAAQRAGLPLAAIATMPFGLAVAFNYLVQRSWVFRDDRPVSATLPQYAAMVALGFLLNVAVLGTAEGRLPLALAQTAAVALVVVSNAVLAFSWVFLRRRRRPSRGSV